GSDAAFPALVAQPRPDRTAMADPARARGDRRDRGYRSRARGISAWSEPVANSARSRSAAPDRKEGGGSRFAPRRGLDLGQGPEADRGGRADVGGDLRRHDPALRRAQAGRTAGHAARARAQPGGVAGARPGRQRQRGGSGVNANLHDAGEQDAWLAISIYSGPQSP